MPWHDISKLAIIPHQAPEILGMIAAYPRSWQQISIRAVAGFVGLLEHTTAALRNPWHDISKLAITPPQAPETISMIAAHPRSWQQISIRAVAGFDELLEHTTAALRNPWHDISKLAIIPHQAPEILGMILASWLLYHIKRRKYLA